MVGCKENKKNPKEQQSVDMSGANYLISLRENQNKMKQEILDFCRNHKKREIVTLTDIYEAFKTKYPMQERGKDEENKILQGVLQNLLFVMVCSGKLEEKNLEADIGYAVVNDIAFY